MKFFLVLFILFFSSSLQATQKLVVVHNDNEWSPLREVYIVPSGSPTWGLNKNVGDIYRGGSKKFYLTTTSCSVDIQITNADGKKLEKMNFPVC